MTNLRKILEFFGLALKKDLDYVYRQRNVAALAAAYIARKGNSVLAKNLSDSVPYDDVFVVDFYKDDQEGWDDDWRMVVQITDTYTQRQISWHLDPGAAQIATALFKQQKSLDWDGTDFSKTFEFLGVSKN